MKSYTVFLNNSVHTREMLIVIILFALTPHWLTINCQKKICNKEFRAIKNFLLFAIHLKNLQICLQNQN